MLSFLSSICQEVVVYQTTTNMSKRLQKEASIFFVEPNPHSPAEIITVDPAKVYQKIDGFGASLTDAAAWVVSRKLTIGQTNEVWKQLFDRNEGIALSILRQPMGSSDLAENFYSYDDLCNQTNQGCTSEEGKHDRNLQHFSMKREFEYAIPLLKQALKINPSLLTFISPWSAPGWMKNTRSMYGLDPTMKARSYLLEENYDAFAQYFVKTIKQYEAAGIPIYAITIVNEALFTPDSYSGMLFEAKEQAQFIKQSLGPALKQNNLKQKIMLYDHNWDRPDYPTLILRDKQAAQYVAGTGWHHYGGNPSVMTTIQETFPEFDQWVTESSGGEWQTGDVMVEMANELITVMRHWSRSYILWALATDEHHGPHLGGCAVCRGLFTVNASAEKATVNYELDYYVLGHASKFLHPGAVRIGSNQPTDSEVKNVAFKNPDGSIVLYVLNTVQKEKEIEIMFQGKSARLVLTPASITSFIWKQDE